MTQVLTKDKLLRKVSSPLAADRPDQPLPAFAQALGTEAAQYPRRVAHHASSQSCGHRGWIGSTLLLGLIVATGAGLAAWKYSDTAAKSEAAAANQPEPMEVDHRGGRRRSGSTAARRPRSGPCSRCARSRCATSWRAPCGRSRSPRARSWRPARCSSRSTSRSSRPSWRPRRRRRPSPRRRSTGWRVCSEHQATSQEEVDQARAERDVALAQMARTRAIIARKTIRAPFRARVGIADVHPGQYLNEGTELTTLQGVAEAAHVDFTVAQRVAAGLRVGDSVGVLAAGRQRSPIAGPDRRASTRGSIPQPATRWCAPDSSGNAAAPRRAPRCASLVPVGPRPRSSVVSGERAPQGAGRRSRLRDRAGLGRARPAPTCGRCRAARCSATRS